MNTDELSTGGGSPSAKSKKREGEKRTSPLTPLREKGKGKEQDRVSCETSCSKTARAHVEGLGTVTAEGPFCRGFVRYAAFGRVCAVR